MSIGKTGFKANLDMFFAPTLPSAPVFIVGNFNVRRLNHQWMDVLISHMPFGLKPSHEVNEIMRQATKANSFISSSREAMPFELPDGYATFLFDSGTLSRPGFIEQLVGMYLLGGDLTRVTQEGHLTGTISIPESDLARSSGNHPMLVELNYSRLDPENSRSVASRKLFEGTAERTTLSPEERKKLKQLLDLVNCEGNLREN